VNAKRRALLGAVLLFACYDFTRVEQRFFETDCANGLDDDGDQLIDCADPDCVGHPCATADRCADGPACRADGTCAGTAKVCDAPPAFCLAPAGACSPATGACSYAADTAASCDDSDPCTVDDRCGVDAGCSGTRYSCLNTECAYSACLGDGGCSAPLVRTGLPCDAGLCLGTGACSTFSYRPSNFDPAAVAAQGIGPALTIGCANAFFDSTDGGSFWCNGQPAPVQLAITQSGGVDAVVLAVSGLSIASGGSLSLTGSRPVIFAVWGDATVAGTLSAASTFTTSGAGQAPSGLCDAQDGVADGALVGGGGGGGSDGSRGGDGGDGDAVGHGGRSGTPSGGAALVPLRGGCPGGSGGRSADPGGAGGRGGAGGGAVQISALGTLTVSGTVTASGAGGQGGLGVLSGSNGGGAGGSGGAVLLEGMDVVMPPSARLTANGGGGGGGGGLADGSTALDGRTTSASPAPGGGAGIACAGKGGQGASALGAPADGESATALCSGGGGGGGLGRIRVNAFTLCRPDAGVLSPVPSYGGVCP